MPREHAGVFSTRQRRAAIITAHRVVDCMDKQTVRASPPISYARKSADGLWYVAVTWGNGRQERLGPFKTEAVAQELIEGQLAAWHEGQKLFRKPPQ
jgi:hypothetical protein